MSGVLPGRALPQIDGLRALAVGEVVAFHAASRVMPSGYIGVDVFLVLSGFLITAILIREYERTAKVRLRQFYARRALRILPALLVVGGVMIGVALLVDRLRDREASLRGAVAALTYTASPFAATGHDLGDFLPTWSLSVQEYFYVVWPVVMVLLLHRPRRTAVVVVTLLTAAAAAYTVTAHVVLHWSDARISYAADTRLTQLLVGVLLALVVSRGRLVVPTWLAILSAVAVVGAIVIPVEVSEPVYYSGGSLAVALLAGAVLVHLVTGTSRLTQWLSWSPLVWVGRRSYGIYLWNLPVGGLVNLFALPLVPRVGLKVALTLIVPAVSFALVERPMLRLRARLASAAPASPTPRAERAIRPTGSMANGPVAQPSAVVPRR